MQINSNKCSLLAVLVALILCSPVRGYAAKDTLARDSRMLVNLLEYIGQDYPNAVEKGEVINDYEYREMKEFTGRAKRMFKKLSGVKRVADKMKAGDSLDIENTLTELQKHIQEKSDKKKILELASKVKKKVLSWGIFKLTPLQWPDIAKGKDLYRMHCANCHGKEGKGDGPAAHTLDPPPTDFLAHVPGDFSPFRVFNVVRLGIEGTGMQPLNHLSDKEVWNVAFYLNSLPYRENYASKTGELEKVFSEVKEKVSLEEVAQSSGKELYAKVKGDEEEKLKKVASIRLHRPGNEKESHLTLALNNLDDALRHYKNKKFSLARSKAISAYLEGVEPVEQQLKATAPDLVAEIENRMAKVRTAISKKRSLGEVSGLIGAAKTTLHKADKLLSEQKLSYWLSFILSSSILLREGLEALLIIVAILSVLRSLQARRAARWVHGGWIIALGIGIAGWFFTDWLVAMGASNRELMEGAGALIAVGMLLYIGFWFHSKTEINKWQAFIKGKVNKLLQNKNMLGLGVISFIVVFREAFESVLFISALNLEVEESAKSSLLAGAIASAILIALIAWLILRFSKNIPVRKLFRYSAVTMGILAIVLAGQGIHALQESGLLSITAMPVNIRLGMLGIFPTIETVIAQLISLVASVVLFIYGKKA